MPRDDPATMRFALPSHHSLATAWSGIAVAAILAACAQQPPAPVRPATPKPAPAAAPTRVLPAEPVVAATVVRPPEATPRPDYTIYFGFDDESVDPRFLQQLATVADHVKERPDAWIILQAHTDSRGSREYNIALAQRRAEEVQRRLMHLGVPDRRIKITAYGEVAPGSDAADSRRVDLFYRYSPR